MPIAVKWLNVLPSERTALRLMPTSRNTLFVAAVEQREAAFGCEAVVNHSFRYVRHTALAGLTTASQPNAASQARQLLHKQLLLRGEQREAAFEAEGLAKPGDRVSRFYDCCAAERSLALLDSCYEVR